MSIIKIIKEAMMYHGSLANKLDNDVLTPNRDEYMIDRALGTHFAADPEVANKFSQGLYKDSEKNKEGTVYKAKAPTRSEIERVPQKRLRVYPDGTSQYKTDQYAVGSHVSSTVLSHPDNKQMFIDWVKNARRIDDDTAEKVHQHLTAGKAPADPEVFGTAASKGSNTFRSYMSNFDANLTLQPYPGFKKEVINKFVDIMKAKGKKGLSYFNTSPMETEGVRSRKSYIIFEPDKLNLE
jgi:hypothetical protein